MENNAIISLSGGLDSTMLLMKLLSEGRTVKAYSFDYGQKHDIELKKVRKNVKFLQKEGWPVEHQVINVRDCFSDSASSLHKGGDEIPKGDYSVENQSSTVIENRNIIFSAIIYGKALAWSKKTDQDVDITLGIHAGDHSVYPDTTQESFEAAKHCYEISNWGSEKVHYIAPFVNITKDQVLKVGIEAMEKMFMYDKVGKKIDKNSQKKINKILKNTHSCYDPDENGKSCGTCGTCKERLEAFEKVGMKDPIEYVE